MARQQRLAYVAHSQGTTIGFALMASQAAYAAKVRGRRSSCVVSSGLRLPLYLHARSEPLFVACTVGRRSPE